jgi:hypothetical protein
MRTFVLMPFGSQNDQLYNRVIKPSVEAAIPGMECRRADEISLSGSILRDIVCGIAQADVIVADLTNRNANVFYELGIAHSLCGKTVMLSRAKKFPFDVLVYRIVRYDLTAGGLDKLGESLKKAVREIGNSTSPVSNPVVDYLPNHIQRISPRLVRAIAPVGRGFSEFLINRELHSSIRRSLYEQSRLVNELKVYVNFPRYEWLPKVLLHGALDCFRSLYQRLSDRSRKAIEVRLYRIAPAWCIYQYDAEMYVSPYLHGVQGSQTLCVHLQKTEEGPGYLEQFEGHFGNIWDNAEELDSD